MSKLIDRKFVIELIEKILGKQIKKADAVKIVDQALFYDEEISDYRIAKKEFDILKESLDMVDCIEDFSWEYVSDEDLKNLLDVLKSTNGKDTLIGVLKLSKYANDYNSHSRLD